MKAPQPVAPVPRVTLTRQEAADSLGVKLEQRDPSPVAVEKGMDSLVAGLNARHPGQSWRVSSPPHALERAGAVGAGHVDHPRIVGPDDQGTLAHAGATGTATDEDVPDHPTDKVA